MRRRLTGKLRPSDERRALEKGEREISKRFCPSGPEIWKSVHQRAEAEADLKERKRQTEGRKRLLEPL